MPCCSMTDSHNHGRIIQVDRNTWKLHQDAFCGREINGVTLTGTGNRCDFECQPQITRKYLGPTARRWIPYEYSTREQAASACNAAGYKGLCSKAQGQGFNACSAGWYSDFKGYWLSKAEPNCGNRRGWHSWPVGKAGAYCCIEVPTRTPTSAPSATPTEMPTTHSPSPSPSHTPTEYPTVEPTHSPTSSPTSFPTQEPKGPTSCGCAAGAKGICPLRFS